MADFDEAAYLEEQLDGKPANGEQPKEEEQEEQEQRKEKKESRKDKHRERDRDKERSRKHSSRDRERSKDRERSSKDRERSSSRRVRERDRDGGSSKRRERSRSRSKDRDSRKRSRSKDLGKERPSERHRSPAKKRERTPPEVREERERERELAAFDRDARTVFAYNLPLKADERDIFEFFSPAGKVVDVRIICDRNTRRSKGFAYVEMQERNDVINAVALAGQLLRGQQVMVKMSEAEKNLAWEASQQAAKTGGVDPTLALGPGPCTLMVSKILPALTEADLAGIFQPFGVVMSIRLVRDAVGNSLGHGFVEYASSADAARAMADLNGMALAGQNLKVTVARPGQADAAIAKMQQHVPPGVTLPPGGAPVVLPPPPMLGAPPGVAMALGAAQEQEQGGAQPEGEEGGLAEEEGGGGMRLTSQARAALMSRLASSAGVNVPDPTAAFNPYAGMPVPQPEVDSGPPMDPALALEQGVLGPASPIPTPCVLLKNMFSPEEETEPDWDQEICEDVKAECGKFGQVVHAYVDKNSKGFVYLKFAQQQGATAAQQALNGRWFAGRRIAAEFQFAAPYSTHFGV